MRVNGTCGSSQVVLPDEMGGTFSVMYACHSYHMLVPTAEHFDKHPDWFAKGGDGKRYGGGLCPSNPDMREYVGQKVLSDLRARFGKVDFYWVSQNDGGSSGCFCDRCTAERLAYGGKDRWSANAQGFVKYVADKIRNEFPKVKIKTLAYSYTQAPPEHFTAPDNVLVEICGNFVDGSIEHADLVRAWSKVAKNISVYTYGGSNFGYWWPYPNVHDVGRQCQRALAAGVTAFYVQGTALGKGSGMVDAKAYVSARLAWDPSRDVNHEVKEFCDGFYGPGGEYIAEYLTWFYRDIMQRKVPLEGSWGNPELWRTWVTKEAMEHSDELFQKAMAATKDNPVYLAHVRKAYLEVLWGSIMINTKPGSDLVNKELNLVPGADPHLIEAKAKLFGQIMREAGYNMWSEVVPFNSATYPH